MRTLLLMAVGLCAGSLGMSAELRIGIIGCDTSHATAFTETLNNPGAPGHIEGGKVVAAFKGGSPDVQESASRVGQYAQTLRDKYGVKFYDRIEDLCQAVDVILLESVDGRPHLAQVKPVLAARKPVFVDKPLAGSLRDAAEIIQLAKAAKVPLFSSSGLRFAKSTQAVRQGSIGKVVSVETWGPCSVEPHHPELFWYGIHGLEAIYTILGLGCVSVQRGTNAEGKIEVVGLWPDGRCGVFREDKSFHGRAKGEKGEAEAGIFDGYTPLLAEVMKFFQTGVAPVPPEETIELFAFMEAAEASKRQGGAPVRIATILKKNGL